MSKEPIVNVYQKSGDLAAFQLTKNLEGSIESTFIKSKRANIRQNNLLDFLIYVYIFNVLFNEIVLDIFIYRLKISLN